MGFFEMIGAVIVIVALYCGATMFCGYIMSGNGDYDIFSYAYIAGAVMYVILFILWFGGVSCPFSSH